jgi:hypothetical protein
MRRPNSFDAPCARSRCELRLTWSRAGYRYFELVVSFMTLAEMRQGALYADWGPRKRDVLKTNAVAAYFRGDKVLPPRSAARIRDAT